ncbi:MAG: alpha/beta fold hydrolase [Stellaceae bacterium]
MNNPKLKGRLHRIQIPALILWGDSDRIVTTDYGRRFAELIPGAAFDLVPGAGHFPHIEQPLAAADKIAAFAGA